MPSSQMNVYCVANKSRSGVCMSARAPPSPPTPFTRTHLACGHGLDVLVLVIPDVGEHVQQVVAGGAPQLTSLLVAGLEPAGWWWGACMFPVYRLTTGLQVLATCCK
jgi:hypothetical protein